MPEQLRVAIAGMGFVGAVHLEAARRAGGIVLGISGGHPEHTAAAAADHGVDRVFTSSEELVTSSDVDVVHICTPNHLHAELARLALAAGKHVVCEKPLTTTVDDAVALVAAAEGRVATVPFVYRFHPVVREARHRLHSGISGSVRLIHGAYLQDWLADVNDYNWRVDPAVGGASRAFADIGSHWCDLVQFITGQRIERVSANMITAVPERVVGSANAFEESSSVVRRVAVQGEDAVSVMFETDGGASGSVMVSQVSYGRKNYLWFEIDAVNESLAFNQEHAEELWIADRSAQRSIVRDPSVLSPDAARLAMLPAGHAQGYADAFALFVADTYAAIRGSAPEGLPTFADGLRAVRITDAVLASSADRAWKEVAQ